MSILFIPKGLEEERLEALHLASRQAGPHERELDVVDRTDQDRVDRREGDGGMAPDLLVGRGDLVDGDDQHEKGRTEKDRRREQHDNPERRARTRRAALRSE